MKHIDEMVVLMSIPVFLLSKNICVDYLTNQTTMYEHVLSYSVKAVSYKQSNASITG